MGVKVTQASTWVYYSSLFESIFLSFFVNLTKMTFQMFSLGLLLFEMKVEGKSFVWQFATWEAEGGYGLDSIYIARGT